MNRSYHTKQGFEIKYIARTEAAIFGQYFVPDDQVDGGGIWFDAMWDLNDGKIMNQSLHETYSIRDYICGALMSETRMVNPYEAIYRTKEAAILAGASTQMKPVGPLHERLRDYAYYVQENATTGAEAMLVMDLLDASVAVKRAEHSV